MYMYMPLYICAYSYNLLTYTYMQTDIHTYTYKSCSQNSYITCYSAAGALEKRQRCE